eukprot:5351019-Alexandrium_andersonii.AAC.1
MSPVPDAIRATGAIAGPPKGNLQRPPKKATWIRSGRRFPTLAEPLVATRIPHLTCLLYTSPSPRD